MSNQENEQNTTSTDITLADDRCKFLGIGVAFSEISDDSGTVIPDTVGIRTDFAYLGPPDKLMNGYEMLLIVKETVDKLLDDPATKLWAVGQGTTRN